MKWSFHFQSQRWIWCFCVHDLNNFGIFWCDVSSKKSICWWYIPTFSLKTSHWKILKLFKLSTQKHLIHFWDWKWKLHFVCYHEKVWLQNCSSGFKPVIYRRHVDDTFLLFCSKHHITLFKLSTQKHQIHFLDWKWKLHFVSWHQNN